MVSLLNPEQLRALVVERFISKEWWILAQGGDCHALTLLEDRFYSGEANADFHMFMTPSCPTFGFAIAHKNRMSAEDFNAFAEESEIPTRVADDQDVLCFHSGGEEGPEECSRFVGWLSGLLDGAG